MLLGQCPTAAEPGSVAPAASWLCSGPCRAARAAVSACVLLTLKWERLPTADPWESARIPPPTPALRSPVGGLVVRVAMRDVVEGRWLQGGAGQRGGLYLRGDLIGQVA